MVDIFIPLILNARECVFQVSLGRLKRLSLLSEPGRNGFVFVLAFTIEARQMCQAAISVITTGLTNDGNGSCL